MSTSVLRNDFTSGIVSPRLYGRYDSVAYRNGCMKLENFAIMPQGGITRRPGTLLKNTPNHSSAAGSAGERAPLVGTRLIPFCLSTEVNFIIELGNNTLRVWKQDASELMRFTFSGVVYTTLTVAQLTQVTSLYTTAEAEQVQYAQDYEHLYIAHKNHKPLQITYKEVLENGSMVPKLEFKDFVPTIQTGDTDNEGFCTGSDCPGVVFYYASRLWFASSKDHPYRLWASRPFQNDSFEFYDIEEVADEGAQASTLENAVIYGILSATSSNVNLKPEVNKITWETVITETGVYIYRYDGANTRWIDEAGNPVTLSTLGITYTGTPDDHDTITVRYFNINEGTVREENVEREDNAIRLEVGSSRNDAIKWLTSVGNYIIVGTAATEWLMPGTVNPQNKSIAKVSDNGSADHIQPVIAGSDIIFLQTGGKKVRSYIAGEGGYTSPNLSYVSGDLGTIKHMAFQRIPEPRLYCVYSDGTLGVLFYDRQYGIQGWAVYRFDGEVKDVCVAGSSAGETVYISIERTIAQNTTRMNLEALNELDIMNGTPRQDCSNYDDYKVPFASRLVTNAYEYNSNAGSSIGKTKRIYKATLRVLNTGLIKVGYRFNFTQTDMALDPKYTQQSTPDMSNMKMADVEIPVGGGFERFVAFAAEVDTTDPATITALSLLTESEG